MVPLMHAINVALWIGPITAYVSICTSVTAILWFPYYLVMSYWTLLVTPKLGPNLKFLLFLVAPVPALLFPVVTVIFGVIAGIFITIVGSFTVSPCEDNPCGIGALKWAHKVVYGYW